MLGMRKTIYMISGIPPNTLWAESESRNGQAQKLNESRAENGRCDRKPPVAVEEYAALTKCRLGQARLGHRMVYYFNCVFYVTYGGIFRSIREKEPR